MIFQETSSKHHPTNIGRLAIQPIQPIQPIRPIRPIRPVERCRSCKTSWLSLTVGHRFKDQRLGMFGPLYQIMSIDLYISYICWWLLMCICFDIVKDRYFDWFVCLYYLLIYYFIDFWICMCAHFYVHAMCMILYVYVQKDAKSISRDWFYIYIISLSIRNGPPRRNSSFTSNECSFTPTVVLYQCKSIDYMHMMSHFMCRRRFHKFNWIRLEGLPHWGCPPPKKKNFLPQAKSQLPIICCAEDWNCLNCHQWRWR